MTNSLSVDTLSPMIPNKSNFKFQELTPITGVKPYVIRFWETEFEEISPVTSDSGQKLYARKDVETILKIKKLLFDHKLSIPEARVQLRSGDVDFSGSEEASSAPQKNEILDEIMAALNLIREIKAKRNW